METSTFVAWLDRELAMCADTGSLDIRLAELEQDIALAVDEQRTLIAIVTDKHDRRLNA